MTAELLEGKKAPAFSAKDKDGKTHKLSDYKGKWVVLYFYPKDDTPGCTVEACSFRDSRKEFEKLDAVVFGCSPDDAKSHDKFTTKFELNFPLLVDEGHKIAESYQAWGEKKNYGKTYEGIIRSTFLIDPKGNLAKIWKNVKVENHVGKVAEALGAARAG
ncbi:MAG: thioredoxin-dependent thiol peroxidase [Planctomycetes bacterium]|nr:thioredoxin-dependent thiol peroxidase [Planctomycetota bacterium]